jgi:hypothetical protein
VVYVSTCDVNRLAFFVRNGGGLVIFTGDKVAPGCLSALDSVGLGVAKIVGPLDTPGRPWRLESWDAKHPIFRPFADPEHGDLRRPAFTTITKVVPDPSARVPARFQGENPAVIERTVGAGRVILFASAADRDWGDWPRGRLYVPLVHQILTAAMGLADGDRVRAEPVRGDAKPGIVVTNGIAHVSNIDPHESDLSRCTVKQFADQFGFQPPEPDRIASKDPRASKTVDDRLRGDELWSWLALGLLGVLMLEHFLANRTAA